MQPDVATFLARLNRLPGPKPWEVPVAEARAMTRAMRGVADLPTGDVRTIRDVAMPGPAGEVMLRVYDARAADGPSPVALFLHGGGWVVGDLDSYAPVCAALARGLAVPVVAVGYRRAPEHPFPAAPDDCAAAARWVAAAPAALGLDPTALLLVGDSAGGNLAIATAMALRDLPAARPLAAHWAIYPAADLVGRYPSYRRYGEGHFLTRAQLRWYADAYRPDLTDPRASPLAGDLAGLAPALVTTAELDPIRDQGRAYAAALAAAGVRVSFREAPGTIHGYLNLRKLLPSAQAEFVRDIAGFRALIAETAE